MRSFKKNAKAELSIPGELWAFLRVRKKWWIGPIFLFLLMLGLFMVLTDGSTLVPFIYSLF